MRGESLSSKFAFAAHANADVPDQATGFKVGEVTDSSAIVWTRLTLRKRRNSSDAPKVEIVVDDGSSDSRRKKGIRQVAFPDGLNIRDVFEAVPGTDGDVRVLWRPTGTSDWADTDWTAVDALRDFTAQLPLENLKSNTAYEVKVESRSVSGDLGQSLSGGFRGWQQPVARASSVEFDREPVLLSTSSPHR